jgi:hypothetical protein
MRAIKRLSIVLFMLTAIMSVPRMATAGYEDCVTMASNCDWAGSYFYCNAAVDCGIAEGCHQYACYPTGGYHFCANGGPYTNGVYGEMYCY